MPSFGVHSTQVTEVPVWEGICTADRPPALGTHPALQDTQCLDNALCIVSPELQIPDPVNQGD